MSRGGPPAPVRSARPRWQWALLAVAILVAALIVCSALIPPLRTAERTAQLLPSFFVQLPVDPTGWLSPSVRQATIDLPGPPEDGEPGGAVLHVYRPGRGRHPALVISLGAAPAGPDNPAVVRLLRGLAQSGIVAVLVESPALNDRYITAAAPNLLVSAYQETASQPYVEPDHVGLMGLSVGGSLALIASADPRIRDHVRLVEAFGAYASLADVIRASVTHSFPVNGQEVAWQPDQTTINVARLNVIHLLAEPDEQAQLSSLLSSSAPPPAQPPASLSPGGQLAFRLLTATDPAQYDAIYATLPAEARAAIESLSPEAYLSQVHAPVFLMVDEDDPLIPYVQSLMIDRALRDDGRTPYLSRFSIFRHVEPTRSVSVLVLLPNLARLYQHVDAVLGRLF